MSCKKASIQLENYRSLVAMLAWKAWRRLPIQTRVWIGIEDMIEDGMGQLIRLSYTYNPKWASFTTAAYHRLHNFYINDYLQFHSAQQRGWTRQMKSKTTTGKPIPHISIQAIEKRLSEKGEASVDDVVGFIPALIVSPQPIIDNLITECVVVPALQEIYKRASFNTQVAFVQWFLCRDLDARIHDKGKRFRRTSKEFRQLCKDYDVTCSDCLHLIRSPGCLDSLSRKVLGIPYDIENPVPVVERML
jgi:hypothetical protein